MRHRLELANAFCSVGQPGGGVELLAQRGMFGIVRCDAVVLIGQAFLQEASDQFTQLVLTPGVERFHALYIPECDHGVAGLIARGKALGLVKRPVSRPIS